MQRLLLDCRSIEAARALKLDLEQELSCEILLSFDPKETETIVANRTVHVLVLRLEHLRTSDLERIQTLRNVGYAYPILIIADSLGDRDLTGPIERLKISCLEKPEQKTLGGVVRKLMSNKNISQQMFRRYHTQQPASLETFISGEVFETQMCNLSVGGAYFESDQKPSINIGDLLRVRIALSDVDKEHNVHGRVVWTSYKGRSNGCYGLGIKFIKSNDIYRQLIDKV